MSQPLVIIPTYNEGLNLREVASQGYCFQIDLARRVVEALWRITMWGFAGALCPLKGRLKRN